jgi:hypothetical protein
MTDDAEKTNGKQRGRPFASGRSGNPAGRPKGCRNRATLAMEALFDGEADAIGRKAVELALSGDSSALRLVLERILPPRRERPVNFQIPKLKTAADAGKAAAALVEAVASGDLTPGEAAELGKLVESFVTTLEATEIEERIAALEARKS